jgi:hypothetical protein
LRAGGWVERRSGRLRAWAGAASWGGRAWASAAAESPPPPPNTVPHYHPPTRPTAMIPTPVSSSTRRLYPAPRSIVGARATELDDELAQRDRGDEVLVGQRGARHWRGAVRTQPPLDGHPLEGVAWDTYTVHIRLQPGGACACSAGHMRLQPGIRMVVTYWEEGEGGGCSGRTVGGGDGISHDLRGDGAHELGGRPRLVGVRVRLRLRLRLRVRARARARVRVRVRVRAKVTARARARVRVSA